jgi:hypothetical protein
LRENSIKFLNNYFCDKFSELAIQITIIFPSNYTLFWLEEKNYFHLIFIFWISIVYFFKNIQSRIKFMTIYLKTSTYGFFKSNLNAYRWEFQMIEKSVIDKKMSIFCQVHYFTTKILMIFYVYEWEILSTNVDTGNTLDENNI